MDVIRGSSYYITIYGQVETAAAANDLGGYLASVTTGLGSTFSRK